MTCRIGDHAFRGCSELTSVVIPSAVTHIGTGVFSNCTRLVSIDFSAQVVGILPPYTFFRCTALTSVTGMSNAITAIGEAAFYECVNLETFLLPSSVVVVEPDAFWNCSSLRTVGVPPSLAAICDHAFGHCSSLQDFNLSHTVLTIIDTGAFTQTQSLTTIHFPSTIRAILEVAFWGSTSLASVSFDSAAVNVVIGSGAFFRTAVTSLVFPNNTVFSPFAVTGIPTLRSITALAPVRSDGTAFSGCGCNASCPSVVAATDLRMCDCMPCTNSSILTPHTGTAVLAELILRLAAVDSTDLLDVVTDYIESNTVPNTNMTSTDLNSIAGIADRLVETTLGIQARDSLGPKTATQMVRLFTSYGKLVRHLLNDGQANSATINRYIALLTSISGKLSSQPLDETELSVPMVASLDESLLNATEDLVSLGSNTVHGFSSGNATIRVEVFASATCHISTTDSIVLCARCGETASHSLVDRRTHMCSRSILKNQLLESPLPL